MKNLLLLLFLGSTICGATILDSIQQKTKCPYWTTFHTSDRLTPDNDNIDDTWRITYNLYCWEDVEFWISMKKMKKYTMIMVLVLIYIPFGMGF